MTRVKHYNGLMKPAIAKISVIACEANNTVHACNVRVHFQTRKGLMEDGLQKPDNDIEQCGK